MGLRIAGIFYSQSCCRIRQSLLDKTVLASKLSLHLCLTFGDLPISHGTQCTIWTIVNRHICLKQESTFGDASHLRANTGGFSPHPFPSCGAGDARRGGVSVKPTLLWPASTEPAGGRRRRGNMIPKRVGFLGVVGSTEPAGGRRGNMIPKRWSPLSGFLELSEGARVSD